MRLYDSELKIMNMLWDQGVMSARDLADVMSKTIGWNRNTTYTVIKKCVDKSYIERSEPHFVCTPIISREDVQNMDFLDMLNRTFNKSKSEFFKSFLKKEKLTDNEINELIDIVNKLK